VQPDRTEQPMPAIGLSGWLVCTNRCHGAHCSRLRLNLRPPTGWWGPNRMQHVSSGCQASERQAKRARRQGTPSRLMEW